LIQLGRGGGWYVKPVGLTPHEAKLLTLSPILQVNSVTAIMSDMNVVAEPQGLQNIIASSKNYNKMPDVSIDMKRVCPSLVLHK
jgi:hypothetical protein